MSTARLYMLLQRSNTGRAEIRDTDACWRSESRPTCACTAAATDLSTCGAAARPPAPDTLRRIWLHGVIDRTT